MDATAQLLNFARIFTLLFRVRLVAAAKFGVGRHETKNGFVSAFRFAEIRLRIMWSSLTIMTAAAP